MRGVGYARKVTPRAASCDCFAHDGQESLTAKTTGTSSMLAVLPRCFASPAFKRTGKSALFGVAQQHGYLDKSQTSFF